MVIAIVVLIFVQVAMLLMHNDELCEIRNTLRAIQKNTSRDRK